MKFEEFRDRAFACALEKGCEAAEAYYAGGTSFSVNVLGGECEKYEVANSAGLNLRVVVGGKNGYAYTEAMEEPEKLAERAMDNARSIESTDEHPMQGKCGYQKAEKAPSAAASLTERERIDLALALEKAALGADARVKRVMHCMFGSEEREERICNTLGLDAASKDRMDFAYVIPVTAEGEELRDGIAFRFDGDALDITGCAREAVEEALSKHGATSAPAGEYRVIVKNAALTDLLAAFSGMFSADAAQKGLSLFKDKLGESIASPLVNITDDPFFPRNPRAFDAEGVPSVRTAVVEGGVLKSFLHNLKTAKKAGVPSTSNGGRAGAASPVTVMPSNFFIEGGETSFEEMLAMLGTGMVITSVAGLHSGLNPVSGEFSLIAEGYLVENGKRTRPVDQITVGGSFISLMKAVVAVGNDTKLAPPSGALFASPSVLVDRLMISGK